MDSTKFKNFIFSILFLLIILIIIGIIYLGKKLQNNILWIFAIVLFIYLIFKLKIILTLKDYERAVIFRFGKVRRVGGPGWTFVFPLIEKPNLVTLRVETIDIPPQNVLTKDNIQLRIDGVLFISVENKKESIINSIVKVENYRKASTMYVVAVLRDIVGEFEITDVITNIEEINTRLKKALESVSKEWGIKVTSVEITDIKIPDDILSAMHEQKAAVQKKLAVYELAESEKAKILAVKDATDQLSDKTVIYYYLKALEKMAEGQSSKIIFPMELTNLLDKVSTTLIKSHDVKKVANKFDDEDLKQYLPFIKSFLKNEKQKKKK
jgi:regulator of protease activity HflC (stomatin/prohibitin superfamily)